MNTTGQDRVRMDNSCEDESEMTQIDRSVYEHIRDLIGNLDNVAFKKKLRTIYMDNVDKCSHTRLSLYDIYRSRR